MDFSETELLDEPERDKPSSFINSLWDPQTRTFIGRTGKSWCLIFIFYVIFYSLLAGFFLLMITVFLQSVIDTDYPIRTGYQSLLKFKPGLGFRPLPDYQSTLIHFVASDPQSYIFYTADLESYSKFYNEVNEKPDDLFARCDADGKSVDDVEKVCKFRLEKLLGSCQPPYFGYNEKKPCVFLKMNKLYGWLPDINNQTLSNHTLVKCVGQNDADLETMGPLNYYPNITVDGKTYGYFSNHYYPYLGQPGYRAPIVAVQFMKPKMNTLAMVKCQLFNLNQESNPVKFEILVD